MAIGKNSGISNLLHGQCTKHLQIFCMVSAQNQKIHHGQHRNGLSKPRESHIFCGERAGETLEIHLSESEESSVWERSLEVKFQGPSLHGTSETHMQL